MERRSQKDECIKLASKSHPGRFYLFNKSTGETQWLPLTQKSSTETTSNSKKESPPKLPVSKPLSKTPAQDRLKRLQHKLKVNQICSQPSKASRHSIEPESKTKNTSVEAKEQENRSKVLPFTSSARKNTFVEAKEQENRSKVLPSTSSARKSKANLNSSYPRKLPSPRRANKRCHSTSTNPTSEVELEKLSKNVPPSPTTNKTLRLSETANTSPHSLNRESLIGTSVAICNSLTPLIANKEKLFHNEDDTKSSTLNNLRTRIVKKIKDFCKIPFTLSKKPPDGREPILNLNRTQDTQCLLASFQEDICQLLPEKKSSIDNTKQSNTSLYCTPKNLNVSTYQRGSANSRLERLRQHLQLQQQSISAKPADKISLFLAGATTTNKLDLPTNFQNCRNNSTNSILQTANNNITNEVEAMDWQPILNEEPIKKISSSDSIVSNEFKRPSLKKVNSVNEGTMGDIYDNVNENLLRFSAGNHKDSLNNNNKWKKEYYYFIVDTNVLLTNLCFIEDLSKMKLCDTKGSMLYVPYAVLQELDKLKMRSGCQEGVKTLAVRAIKYLNTKFENKCTQLQAQSALEERDHLIEINSADDGIINCCLQAKKHVPNLLFLTDDVNLRNKAICNNILVACKSDLVSKNYDANYDKP